MNKRLSLFLGILLSFTFIFSVFGNGELAKAASSRIHYDDVLVGTNNLNGTTNNSAKLLDRLVSPEKGWKRYDDSNSKIKYVGQNWIFNDKYDEYGSYYKSTSSYIGYKDSVKFTIIGSKLRIIGAGAVGYRTTDERFNTVMVYVDGVSKGYLKHTVESGTNLDTSQIIMFEYTFDSFGKHEIEIVREKVEFGFGFDAIDLDSNGQLVDDSIQYNPILNVESPITNNAYTGSFNLSGYALNQSGIKAVKTYIDDVYSRDTQIGIQRTDVGTNYPAYPGANNSGFSTTYNASDFSIGTHIMKVQAIGNDGTIQEKLLYLYVYSNKIIVSPDNNTIAPFFRYCNGPDHFYSVGPEKVDIKQYGYEYEGLSCYVYKTQKPGTVPLYRYNNGIDHFYTTGYSELGEGKYGYVYEGISCYVYPTQQPGTVPLYRYANGTEHFYTTGYSELGNGNYGYVLEKIECYVLPAF